MQTSLKRIPAAPWRRVLLQAACWTAVLVFAASSACAQDAVYEPYADEALAMARYKADPSEENRAELAAVRYRHAAEIFETLDDLGDHAPSFFARALSYAESAALLAPDVPAYWRLYGRIAMTPANVAELQEIALVALETAHDLDPDDPTAIIMLAGAYKEQGWYGHAAAMLETLLAKDPRAAENLDFVAAWTACHVLAGEPLDGAYALRNVLANNPDLVAVATARLLLLRTAKKTGLATVQEVAAAAGDLGIALESASGTPAELRDFALATLKRGED